MIQIMEFMKFRRSGYEYVELGTTSPVAVHVQPHLMLIVAVATGVFVDSRPKGRATTMTIIILTSQNTIKSIPIFQ